MVVWFVIASAMWVLDIEITYERNMRRGIPANFRIHHPNAINNWRA